MSSQFEAVIGLEIHAQLKTQSKIFCADSTRFDAGDNENTSPISVGMPGTLPVLNKKVIEYAIKAGLALNCEIQKTSYFSRKNYFYPDLPKGYQISQYEKAICENGYVSFQLEGKHHKISIVRAHLEEDAGKSTHFADNTLVNYNRAGVPLLEIVSGPDLRSAQEAAEYARTVRRILKYVDVCDGNLEEGSLRCDCNVSIRKVGESKLGTKVEIKNVNSFRFVEKAIEYEIQRQIDALERNEDIVQETRLWDPDKNRTLSMRTKEDAQDYRYFPDPDLLPMQVSEKHIEEIRQALPELPERLANRFMAQYGLSFKDTMLLTDDREIAEFFEATNKLCGNPKSSANWIMTEVLREVNERQASVSSLKLKPKHLAEIIKSIDQGSVSGKIAKQIFNEVVEFGKNPLEIINEKGYVQISDESELVRIIEDIISRNPEQAADFRAGKTKIMGYFVGAVMKVTRGQANPDVVNRILLERLK